MVVMFSQKAEALLRYLHVALQVVNLDKWVGNWSWVEEWGKCRSVNRDFILWSQLFRFTYSHIICDVLLL